MNEATALLQGLTKPVRDHLHPRVGRMAQLASLRRVVLDEGTSKGVEVVEVATGSGLRFDVLPSRGMDIGHAEFCGLPLAWRSPTGEVSPSLYDARGLEWLRSFHGGLLTGCGLTHVGPPWDSPDHSAGLHGRLSNTPASEIATSAAWQGDRYVLSISGTVRESRVFGENLAMRRTITTELGSTGFTVEDEVVNDGFEATPHMLLYHVNVGWPIADAGSRVFLPSVAVIPRDETSASGVGSWSSFPAPNRDSREEVFFHTLEPNSDGLVRLGIARSEPPWLGVELRFSRDDLPHFVQWKMAGAGTYVIGLEPATCLVEDFSRERVAGRVVFLEPGEIRRYRLEVSVLAGEDAINGLAAVTEAETAAPER
jgi:galactose mutarotase-like enzyme